MRIPFLDATSAPVQIPLEIDYGNIGPTPALTDAIRRHAAKLERFHERVTGCRVSIETPHRHHHQGKPIKIHIRLTVPGSEINVSHESGTAAHQDPQAAIRDAFDAARRQLEDYARRQRGDVKRHSAPNP